MEKIIKKPGVGKALLIGAAGALSAPFFPFALFAGGLFGYLLLSGGVAPFLLSAAVSLSGAYWMANVGGLWVACASIAWALLTAAFLKKNKGYFDTVFAGAALYTAAFYLLISLPDIRSGGVAFGHVTTLLSDLMEQALAAAQAMSVMLTPEQTAMMQETARMVRVVLPVYMPAILCVTGGVISLVNLVVCAWRCRKAGVKLRPMRRFAYWRVPKEFVTGVAIMALGAVLASALHVANMDAVAAAVAALGALPFVVQGACVVMFVLQFSRSHTTVVMFCIFIVLMMPMSITFLGILGVIEQLFQLRTRIILRSKGDDEDE
ncbi:MAG TPA: DUF2232 domain-containing protein [Feifaniaceae bacterium]|nr:DUF2232 domain-containing protein [Feifaniaceae bacterium]